MKVLQERGEDTIIAEQDIEDATASDLASLKTALRELLANFKAVQSERNDALREARASKEEVASLRHLVQTMEAEAASAQKGSASSLAPPSDEVVEAKQLRAALVSVQSELDAATLQLANTQRNMKDVQAERDGLEEALLDTRRQLGELDKQMQSYRDAQQDLSFADELNKISGDKDLTSDEQRFLIRLKDKLVRPPLSFLRCCGCLLLRMTEGLREVERG